MVFQALRALNSLHPRHAPSWSRSGSGLGFARNLAIAVSLVGALGLGACSQNDNSYQPDAQNCGLNRDQQDSWMPRLLPDGLVQVSIDEDFSGGSQGQETLIEQAIGVWNTYYSDRHGRQLFAITSGSVAAQSVPTKNGDCDFEAPSDQFFHVVRVNSESAWTELGLNATIPAVTMRCSSGSQVSKQVVLINTDHTDSRQFMTIALHELGHAIALDHSCATGTGSETYIKCSKVPSGSAYYQAVMFPIFRVGLPGTSGTTDIKQNLRQNDISRADCLYKDL